MIFPLFRTKRSVFQNLLVSMIAFGVSIGLIFPLFTKVILGSENALSPVFFVMCVAAGFLVGLVNFQLFRIVVSRELAHLVSGMGHVLENVAAAENAGHGCEDCSLEVTSNDAVGEIQQSFNDMTNAIARRLNFELRSRSLHAKLSSSVELEEVSQTFLTAIMEASEAKAGLLYADKGQALHLLANIGIDLGSQLPKQISWEYGPLNQAQVTGKIFSLSPQKDGLEWFELSTPLGSFRPGLITTVPLMVKERAIGIALLAAPVTVLQPDQIVLLEMLRRQGAPYLQNSVLHRRIRDLAAIDDLTNVLNRRFGLRRLKEEFTRAIRHGVPASVMMVDVDHFKDFNDSFGHDAGDAVLKNVASVIESNLRTADILCRYGGEEFMVVTPGTGLTDCAKLAERIRRKIETNRTSWDTQQLSVTVSMGLATWPMVRASTPEELVSAADKALYFAKESGRNQVAAIQGDQVLPAKSLQGVDTVQREEVFQPEAIAFESG
jgi:diguanylate cyclase (GGDEF)-like protein